MMTLGRLRAIESFNARATGLSKELLAKVNGELIAEVKRLRAELQWIADYGGVLAAAAICRAEEALREPDHGPPDIVCRRGTLEEEEFKWEGSDGT